MSRPALSRRRCRMTALVTKPRGGRRIHGIGAHGPVRQRFLADFLDTEEDQYVGYWTVRRYVGKGTPPVELRQAAAALTVRGAVAVAARIAAANNNNVFATCSYWFSSYGSLAYGFILLL